VGRRADAPQLVVAYGHRWVAMLESGEAKSLREIARREGVDSGYVSRMVNLTTPGTGYRGGHRGRDSAAGGDTVRAGGRPADAVGGAAGEN
jgi:hypothetical protein